MPSAMPSQRSMAAARALSEQLLDGDDLPPWPAGMPGLAPGERMLRTWVGPQGTLHTRNFSKLRHWWLILDGQPLVVDVTSHRVRVTGGPDDIPLRRIRRLEPRARDLSVLDIALRSGDRLRLWGEHVPEFTVVLGWLIWRRVISVPEDVNQQVARTRAQSASPTS
jgi:hypothetical protein